AATKIARGMSSLRAGIGLARDEARAEERGCDRTGTADDEERPAREHVEGETGSERCERVPEYRRAADRAEYSPEERGRDGLLHERLTADIACTVARARYSLGDDRGCQRRRDTGREGADGAEDEAAQIDRSRGESLPDACEGKRRGDHPRAERGHERTEPERAAAERPAREKDERNVVDSREEDEEEERDEERACEAVAPDIAKPGSELVRE